MLVNGVGGTTCKNTQMEYQTSFLKTHHLMYGTLSVVFSPSPPLSHTRIHFPKALPICPSLYPLLHSTLPRANLLPLCLLIPHFSQLPTIHLQKIFLLTLCTTLQLPTSAPQTRLTLQNSPSPSHSLRICLHVCVIARLILLDGFSTSDVGEKVVLVFDIQGSNSWIEKRVLGFVFDDGRERVFD